MSQSIFRDRIIAHTEHVKKVGKHCSTEETTKQALILPFLDVLGFTPMTQQKLKLNTERIFPELRAENGSIMLYSAMTYR